MSNSITPVPNEEEAVAISAAIEALWPRPVVLEAAETGRRTSWRFSGRWWANDAISRRGRPGF